MIRRPPRSTQSRSSAASDVYKRQLYEMVTKVDTIAVLVNPTRSIIDAQLAEVREATARLGVKVVILRAKSEAELEDAFAPLAKQRIGALLVAADPFFLSVRRQLVTLVARHKVP